MGRQVRLSVMVICVLVFATGVCSAANFVSMDPRQYSVDGKIITISRAYANDPYVLMFSDPNTLKQEVSVQSDGTGIYRIICRVFNYQVSFIVEKSFGLQEIFLGGGGAPKTPSGDTQQDAATATMINKQLMIKIVKDLTVEYMNQGTTVKPNYKKSQLLKAGSWIRVTFK
ncbi:MAG: hypothetical protein CSYNP_01962 [Syntrophus sp. SKADARSKE-3]|nr:hypothetical protein [Syntrophus sp. SKADARSKE-3]